jgi:signal transduction histidine kinase/DNA-binding response OmpR family regulator
VKKSAALFCLALQFVMWSLVAQTNYRFRHYSLPAGISDVGANDMFQDSLGFIWLIHTRSFDRFDGYTFKTYRHDPDDSLFNIGQEQGNHQVYLDAKGDLWINKLNNTADDWRSGVLLRYDHEKDGFIRHDPHLYGGFNGAMEFGPIIWIGGRDDGLWSFNPATGETRQYVNPTLQQQDSLASNTFVGIWDRGTYLNLLSLNGLWKMEKATGKFTRPPCDSQYRDFLYSERFKFVSLPDKQNQRWIRLTPGGRRKFFKIDSLFNIVQKLELPESFNYWLQDNNNVGGGFWLTTTDRGSYKFEEGDTSIVNIRHLPADPLSLPDNWVYSHMRDRDDNVWISTNKGVSKTKRQSVKVYNTPTSMEHGVNQIGSEIIISEFVTIINNKIVFGENDRIWTTQVKLKDSLTFNAFPYKKPTKLFGAGLTFFSQSWKGRRFFWVAAHSSGVLGFPIDSLTGEVKNGPVFHLYPDWDNTTDPNTVWAKTRTVWEDSNENLWVGTYAGLFKVDLKNAYDKKGAVTFYQHIPGDEKSLSFQIVNAIVPEDGDAFLVATDVGVDLFNDGAFEHIFKSRERVSSVFRASDSTVFVGTEGGLYQGRKSNGHYTFTKSLLVTQPVRETQPIVEDDLNRLWISTPTGIVCLDRRQDIAVRLNEMDGFLSTSIGEVNGAPRLCRSPEGLIVISFTGGFSVFDPMTLTVSKRKVKPVLTELLVNNRRAIVKGHPTVQEDFVIDADIALTRDLELDYLHNNFSITFAAMEMVEPESNLYRHKLEGYDPEWIATDYKNRTASYTNLPSGVYTLRVKASNHHGVWSDFETTQKITILPPPWKTWWAYTGYSLLAVALLLFARRSIVQRERLKSNLQLAIVEQEKEHFELEKAKEVDRVKTSFFTNISHEFRTPLTLIKGPVESLIEKFKDDPEAVKRLNLVKRNSELLLRLINQLLDLAKLESGSLKVEKSEGNPFSLIRAVASSFESFARQKTVSLLIEVPDKTLSVIFDKEKLETILINLINNAIKFTPPNGTVTVTAEVYQYYLVLAIKDTGIGIPKDHQEKIFERFHQVSEAHKEVGTGIGLSLVKELVSLMKGRITVTSEAGAGSEFMVTLPIEILNEVASVKAAINGEAHADQLPGYAETASPRGLTTQEDSSNKPHILVVEDNSDLREFIIDSLGPEFHFLQAGDGKVGLETATASVPDLIISDVMMPEMDGVTMTQKIKEDIRTSHIPVILLTAKSGEDSKLTGLQSGAEDYLTKPFNKQELLLKVRNRISLQLKLREKLRLELMKEAPAVNVQSADEKFLLRIKEVIHERMSDEQLSVESMADEIGISRSQLYRKVTALTGLSMNELIRNFRLKRAAQLLQQNWGPVSQVAYEVGFSNLSYFSKVFKEEFGVLPSEYEKS